MILFFYSLIRGSVATLRMLASGRHASAQRRYEQLQGDFEQAELDCKAAEVSMGRPMDYAAQLRLLKLFEAAEAARLVWVRRANQLNSRKLWEQRIVAFRGRKLPYSFGLIDMALIMQVVDHLGVGLDTATLSDWISAML